MKQKARYGFNFLWMVSKGTGVQEPDLKALDFMQSLGLDFVRIPLDYRLWTNKVDYFNPNFAIFKKPLEYFKACEKRKIHLCLNLHRAPGYCINNNHLETHNLWTDQLAQDAFIFIWENYTRLFKGVPAQLLSFDLINEPPEIGRYGLTRENHAALIRKTVEAILSLDPERPIVIDGLGGGNLAMPELADLANKGVAMSTRGYQPMALTHYKANWCEETKGLKKPQYPGTDWNGLKWDKETLRKHYTAWLELTKLGVEVQIGEFGCYNTVENEIALRWFADLLSLFKEWGFGYALWNFKGPFGLVEHGRPNTTYTRIGEYLIDKKLLDLFLENRVS